MRQGNDMKAFVLYGEHSIVWVVARIDQSVKDLLRMRNNT